MIFVDEVRIHVKSGDGGQGCESYYRDRYMRYPRPDGGNGGKGGDVIVMADRGIQTLLDLRYKQHYRAAKGGNASSKGKSGKVGADCIIRVPLGTILRDHATGLVIRELMEDQQSIVVVKGAPGGLGNAARKITTAPGVGEERILDVELKLIADVGIIGFPNAGKSTFLTSISNAKSKIASYPFTTMQPILGIVSVDADNDNPWHFTIADLPGIIEGAHQGKGLGDRFLRHAERTKILLHMIDMAGSEGRDPLEDYKNLEHELREYSDQLACKDQIVVANKMDLPEAAGHLKRFKRKYKKKIVPVSSLRKEGLDEVIQLIRKILCQENSQGQSSAS
ncbi:MAG: GTPase ObgE [Candidatus Omnitrophica bacterium]|nr:GTPase ObgE [Candidatus Omnitrophota bacterium]